MSALAKLKNQRCAECWRRGHVCQAQIIATSARKGADELECELLCMRCADGELCCFETAKRLPCPSRMTPEAEDLCVIPYGFSAANVHRTARASEDRVRVKLRGEGILAMQQLAQQKYKSRRKLRQDQAGKHGVLTLAVLDACE
jgi:hypothetical protein